MIKNKKYLIDYKMPKESDIDYTDTSIDEVPLEDPDDNPFYQANFIKQKEKSFLSTRIGPSNEVVEARLQIQIFLVQGGVEVIYNPDAIIFASKEEKTVFRRAINAFFIRNDFNLEQTLFPVEVYRCGTRENHGTIQFVFSPDDTFLSDEETHQLNLIISDMFHHVLVVSPQED